MSKKITTVLGDIPPEELGYTTAHEHVLADITLLGREVMHHKGNIPAEMLELRMENLASLRQGMSIFSDDCSLAGDIDFAVAEFKAFQRIGGRSVVDASPIGLRAPAELLKEAAQRSGIHLVTCTGIYYAAARPDEYIGKDDRFMYEVFKKEIENGIDGTDVKPGFLKCAVNTINKDGSLEKSELDALRAQARLSNETGLSVHVHTGYPMTNEHLYEVVDVALKECGMNPDRLLMMHQDQFLRRGNENHAYLANPETGRNVNTDYLEKILDQGVYVGFDSWGTYVTTLPDDYDRLKGLIAILKKGYGSQIVCGHDCSTKAYGKTAGSYGYTRFPEMLGQLHAFGLSEEVRKLTVENPANLLAY
ncbi:hypothetical protein [Paenibacillus sp.]|uniref:phosphotriesterase family protein n=1 Tax=Paenibacillus sp. TaxID=58172 RepID=UPI002D3FEE4F|nr:hypothetical protein [Paenibacillus sp.]HZG87981.1 hypothetical protein [Paenibacillus sp.]